MADHDWVSGPCGREGGICTGAPSRPHNAAQSQLSAAPEHPVPGASQLTWQHELTWNHHLSMTACHSDPWKAAQPRSPPSAPVACRRVSHQVIPCMGTGFPCCSALSCLHCAQAWSCCLPGRPCAYHMKGLGLRVSCRWSAPCRQRSHRKSCSQEACRVPRRQPTCRNGSHLGWAHAREDLAHGGCLVGQRAMQVQLLWAAVEHSRSLGGCGPCQSQLVGGGGHGCCLIVCTCMEALTGFRPSDSGAVQPWQSTLTQRTCGLASYMVSHTDGHRVETGSAAAQTDRGLPCLSERARWVRGTESEPLQVFRPDILHQS